MIAFSKLEKKVLTDMVELYKLDMLCHNSLINKIFDNKIYLKNIIDEKPIKCRIEIWYEGISKDELKTKLKYLNFLVFRLIEAKLIKTDFQGNFNFEFENQSLTNVVTINSVIDSILYTYLSFGGNNKILVSHFLVELVENKFKTSEQIRHEQAMGEAQKQVKYSRWAFYGSIAAFLSSIIFGIIQMCSETKIDQSQFNQLKQSIEQKALPKVFKTEIINDTLTTKIVAMPNVKSTIQSK